MSDAASKPVALVTGAAQGIGEGIARVLGEAGYIVVLGDVDGEPRAQTAAGSSGPRVSRRPGCAST